MTTPIGAGSHDGLSEEIPEEISGKQLSDTAEISEPDNNLEAPRPSRKTRRLTIAVIVLSAALVVCLSGIVFAYLTAFSQTERADQLASQLNTTEESLVAAQDDLHGMTTELVTSKGVAAAAEANFQNCKTADTLYSAGMLLVLKAAQSGLNTANATVQLRQALESQRIANTSGCIQ